MKLRGAPAPSQVRTASSSRPAKSKGAYLSRMAMDLVEIPVSGCTCTSTPLEHTQTAHAHTAQTLSLSLAYRWPVLLHSCSAEL